jgi:hypothetical protein
MCKNPLARTQRQETGFDGDAAWPVVAGRLRVKQ